MFQVFSHDFSAHQALVGALWNVTVGNLNLHAALSFSLFQWNPATCWTVIAKAQAKGQKKDCVYISVHTYEAVSVVRPVKTGAGPETESLEGSVDLAHGTEPGCPAEEKVRWWALECLTRKVTKNMAVCWIVSHKLQQGVLIACRKKLLPCENSAALRLGLERSGNVHPHRFYETACSKHSTTWWAGPAADKELDWLEAHIWRCIDVL